MCRADLGRSPLQLIEEIRLKWVWWYLCYSATPITEIALICGFNSPSNLAKVFRRRFGKPPRFFLETALQPSVLATDAGAARPSSTRVSQSGSISGTEDNNSSV